MGKTLDTNKNTGIYHDYLCALNVKWFSFDFTTVKQIKLEEHEKERYLVKRGDLLICEGGDVGRSAIWESENPIYYQNALHRVRFHGGINPYFFLFSLYCYKHKGIIDDVSGGVTIKHFTQNAMRKIVFPLPPIAEQRRIVAEVERWFALIDDLEANKQDLQMAVKRTKAKVLDLAIHGKLVPQDPADEPAIDLLHRINPHFIPSDTSHYQNLPQGWTICRLMDVFEIVMGSSPNGSSINTTSQGVEFHQGKIYFTDKYLKTSDIYTNAPSKFAEPYSILLCVRAPVGIVNITERKICIGRGLCTLKPKTDIDLLFAFYALQTHAKHFDTVATGTTFKAIGGDTIRNEEYILPPYKEQIRIRQCIETLMQQLDSITTGL